MEFNDEGPRGSQLDARALIHRGKKNGRPYIAAGARILPLSPPSNMAIARPIRMLGAACILLCLFLVFQLRQGSPNPSSKLVHGMTRDPLLDRVFATILHTLLN